MKGRYIFHLSIPVSDLSEATRFYVDVLEAEVGRQNPDWVDILLWGHQVTLHRQPDEVLPLQGQGKRHFGVTLPWAEWERTMQRIRALGAGFLGEPTVLLEGSPQEQAKFYLADPGNNVIEVKTYRDVGGTLGIQQ